jgi:hypothetical protein
MAGINLHTIQAAAVNGDHGALDINQIVLAQYLGPFILLSIAGQRAKGRGHGEVEGERSQVPGLAGARSPGAFGHATHLCPWRRRPPARARHRTPTAGHRDGSGRGSGIVFTADGRSHRRRSVAAIVVLSAKRAGRYRPLPAPSPNHGLVRVVRAAAARGSQHRLRRPPQTAQVVILEKPVSAHRPCGRRRASPSIAGPDYAFDGGG